ncbi:MULTISPECIES: hypothetical protein [Agrobacterium]|jgi:hypothetical protein|uniref:Antitoxin VbhA domain-containing protein n=1 Tax=Agrobacterium tumefaciens TaxID=358 RepID=A0AAW8M2Z4_AGRTU|nr:MULTISPECIES: hypothetical protein [Agrobacterium]MBP2511624.1 hypothetical protein [Agrobacterium tumefaciens]MBP2520795.1 hypothetical protein [Agrobacterium tumefaciens]MBP2536484.1 hypothetical protein [Agrobacterium tumefaciens]MBP2542066.1 hypothetical protein [Agrobacterium tumefaciens]MBP2568446.1 hypothetical protein [Agrobacterium tumefaciens]
MSTDPETRRANAQRAIDRAAARGMPIDKDPAFVALLEEWIRGDIDIKAMRERYLDIIALQAAERRGLRKSRLGINPSESSDEANEE